MRKQSKIHCVIESGFGDFENGSANFSRRLIQDGHLNESDWPTPGFDLPTHQLTYTKDQNFAVGFLGSFKGICYFNRLFTS